MKIRQGFVSNSSSSSFVCSTGLSIGQVKEKLKMLLEFYNEFNNQSYEFKDVFGFIGKSQNRYKNDKESSDWYTDEVGKGKLVICSNGSNSIPYDIWEFIESKFEAYRVHHG